MAEDQGDEGGRMPPIILIVEEHAGLRDALHDWMRISFPEHRVRTAACGEDAVAFARVDPPRLVLLDVELPGISGFEAARRIRATNATVHIVIVGIHDAAAYRADATAAGANEYLTKSGMLRGLPAIARALRAEAAQAEDGPPRTAI
jgi:two-component system response regulator MprA